MHFPTRRFAPILLLILAACGAPKPHVDTQDAGPLLRRGPVPDQPDVLIYLIDTLRKDHLGCYHYPLETSPAIDAFAEQASIFSDMIPMSSWTRPSVASMLTGTLDYTHRAIRAEDHLREGLPSLARALEAAGWDTASIVTNPAVGSLFGFGKDFQYHADLWQKYQPVGWEADVEAVDTAIARIAEAADRPQFIYLHTMAPHRDYAPPEAYRDRFMPERFVGTRSQVNIMKDMALYDAEIRFSDDQFARVIDALKRTGRYDNALIVLLSDHGEQFMEHGELAHAASLHFAEMGVPFIVKLPGNRRSDQDIRYTVQMADVAPTILDALGLAIPAGMEGRSLMPLITLEGSFPPQPAVSRLYFGEKRYYMAQTQWLKYIFDATRGEGSWYDIIQDERERDPRRTPPEDGEALKAHADAFAAHPIAEGDAAAAPLTGKQRDVLDALGYL